MGCINSKPAGSASPDFDISEAIEDHGSVTSASSSKQRGGFRRGSAKKAKKVRKEEKQLDDFNDKKSVEGKEEVPKNNACLELQRSNKERVDEKSSFSVRFGNLHKVEAEQVVAGWPSWLSAAAGEAIHGLLPLRAESFEKLEKVTFSSFFYFLAIPNTITYSNSNKLQSHHVLYSIPIHRCIWQLLY